MVSKYMIHGNTHIAQSRADDLESLFYMLMFMFYGELPWKARHSKANDFDDILDAKLNHTPKSLWPTLPSN